jgi:hypothetical protein
LLVVWRETRGGERRREDREEEKTERKEERERERRWSDSVFSELVADELIEKGEIVAEMLYDPSLHQQVAHPHRDVPVYAPTPQRRRAHVSERAR